MKKILTAFCFTDIHNQQSMLDYPTTLRKSLVAAKELAVDEFGLADVALIGGDNVSDYPYWNRSCALPKKNFLDIKAKLHGCASSCARDGKVLYVAGNNDMILGDIATKENEPYNTTDFYDLMDAAFGELPVEERLVLHLVYAPTSSRGQKKLEIIEDIVPLYQIPVTLKKSEKSSRSNWTA